MTEAVVLKEDIFGAYFSEQKVRLLLDKGNTVEGTLIAQDKQFYYLKDVTYYAIKKARILAVPCRRVQLVSLVDA
jgi:small nuclear ribonucleoprotein (snRNP)-like protein